MNFIMIKCNVISIALIYLFTTNDVVAQNPPCYLCDNDSEATIMNPTLVVDLSSFGLPIASATCQQIFDAGRDGLLTVDQCSQALNSADGKDIQKKCECVLSKPVTGAPTFPASIPSTSPPTATPATPYPTAILTIAPVAVPIQGPISAAPLLVTPTIIGPVVNVPTVGSPTQLNPINDGAPGMINQPTSIPTRRQGSVRSIGSIMASSVRIPIAPSIRVPLAASVRMPVAPSVRIPVNGATN